MHDSLFAPSHNSRAGRIERDTDGSGKIDIIETFDTSSGKPILSRREEDRDGDGDMDVLSVENKIAWYENTDGKGSFGPQQVITTAADAAQSIYAADVDGDDRRFPWLQLQVAHHFLAVVRTIDDCHTRHN